MRPCSSSFISQVSLDMSQPAVQVVVNLRIEINGMKANALINITTKASVPMLGRSASGGRGIAGMSQKRTGSDYSRSIRGGDWRHNSQTCLLINSRFDTQH